MGKINSSIGEDLYLIANDTNRVYIVNGDTKIDTTKLVSRTDTYTKEEIDKIISMTEGLDRSNYYDKDEIDTYTKEEIDKIISMTLDRSNYYDKDEIDTLLKEIFNFLTPKRHVPQ